MREHFAAKHERQKDLYDQRAHGEPYKEGDLVWLLSPVILRGQCRIFYHPWTGPFKVVKCLSDVNYRIQSIRGCTRGRCHLVVHFDRLKHCHLNTRFDITAPAAPGTSGGTPLPPPQPVGTSLKIQDADDPVEPAPFSPTLPPVPPPPAPLPPAPPPPVPPPHYPGRVNYTCA